MIIAKEMVTKQCTRMPNWKAPGMDRVQGFWLNNLTSLHERIAKRLSLIVNRNASLPHWLTLGRRIMCLRACLHEGEPARIAELARLGEMIYRSVYMQGSTQPGCPGWPHLRFVNEIARTK